MTIRASALLGATVVDRHDRRLGTLSDLLLDEPRPGRVCYALIDVDAATDGDGRTVAVPWSVLQPDGSHRRLVLDVSRGALRRMSHFRGP
jgi:sporulation protein YlmC with PRC-barrel domain